jgi:hypothetical protein
VTPILALLLAAAPAAEPAAPLPPALVLQWQAKAPASLARFEPLKAAFADASAEERAALEEYARACIGPATEAARAELRALGLDASALPSGSYRDRACGAAQSLHALTDAATRWPAFQAALHEAWPVYAGYEAAVANAERLAQEGLGAETAALAARKPAPVRGEALRARIVGEQVLRLGWNTNGGDGLSPAAHDILLTLIRDATSRRDHANTDWLKREVERSGWPTRVSASPAGTQAAWLIAQHADDDPAFQARALRLMTPLAQRGLVPKPDYALLYDRVMMKVAGRQRYGSQYECREGRFQPRPLEDPAKVDALRKAMGLGTLAQNTARIRRENAALCR